MDHTLHTMKYFLVLSALIFTGSFSINSAIAQSDKEEAAARKHLEVRLAELRSILSKIDWQPAPIEDKQLSKPQRSEEIEWRKWLLQVRNELKDQEKDIDQLLRGLGNVMQANGSLVRAASELNLLQTENQRRILKEGGEFDQLTEASKARHDIAMNAIRNLKA